MPLTRKTGLSGSAVAVDETPQVEAHNRKVKLRFSKAEILSVYRSYPVVPRGMQEHPGVTLKDPLVPMNLRGDGEQEQHATPRVEKLRLTPFDKPNQGEHVINSPAANQRRGLSVFGQGGSPTVHGGLQNRKSTGSGTSQSIGEKSSPYWSRGMRSSADSNINWRGSSKVPTSPPATPSPSLPPLMPTNRRDLSAFTKQSAEKDREREKSKDLDDQQKIWQYRDPQMIVQGPFSASQLMEWLKAGYYSEDLPVRALEETEFRPLVTVFGLKGEENAPPGFTKVEDDFAVADPSAAGDTGDSLSFSEAKGDSSGEFFKLDQVGPKFHDDGDDGADRSEILHQEFSGMVLDSSERGGDSQKPSDSPEEDEQTAERVRPTIAQRSGGYSSSLPTTSRFANVMRGQLSHDLDHDVSSVAGGKTAIQEPGDKILPVQGLEVVPTGKPPVEYRSAKVDGEANVPSILDLLANSVTRESKSTEQKGESLMAIDPAIASFGCQVESKQMNSDQWWLEHKVLTTDSNQTVDRSPPREASDQSLVSGKEATPKTIRQVGTNFSSANQSGTGSNSLKEPEPHYDEGALGLDFSRGDMAGVKLRREQKPHIARSLEGSVGIHGLAAGTEADRTQKIKFHEQEQDVVRVSFTAEKELKGSTPDDIQQSAETVGNAKIGKGSGASTKQSPALNSDERENEDSTGAVQDETMAQWETVEAPGSRGKNRKQRQNLETHSEASLETQAQPQLIGGRGVDERTNRGESNTADAVGGITVKEEYSKQPSSRGTAAAPWTASDKATKGLDALPSLKDIQEEEAKRAEEQKKRNLKQLKLRQAQAPKAGAGGPAWGGVAAQQAKSTSLVDILREEARQKAKEENARMMKKETTQISTTSGWAAKVAGANRPPEQAAASIVHRPVPTQKQMKSTGSVLSTASAQASRPAGPAGSVDQDGENFWEAAEASLRRKGSAAHVQASTLLTASATRAPAERQIAGSAMSSVSNTNPPHQSMSAKQNAFGASMSPDFAKWCQGEMRKITGSSDTTLPEFLLTLRSAWEIKEYVVEYLGTSEKATGFADEFVRRKNFEQADSSNGPADADTWNIVGGQTSGKKKKGRASRA
ncbi:hypothetical protein NDN08_007003 [Rhodosorus marinus]|uniref:GYF domain-containing protein n=1 Tax=Rhodosorus marinus TaxID=101924 RepID=A0AAV8UN92_9RHOD|nr:hypothetical protein NDN08_007003 [Rhodosorus marinus]